VALDQPLHVGVALLASAEAYTPTAQQLIDRARERLGSIPEVAHALAENLPAPKQGGGKSRRRRRKKKKAAEAQAEVRQVVEAVADGHAAGSLDGRAAEAEAAPPAAPEPAASA
jgi:hypothetical protein